MIAHLDMDAFFAAIEERNNPQWRGLPIVVGADPRGGHSRGVVSTANYAARAYGIRSALPINQAWRLSEAARAQGKPPVIFTRGSWQNYSQVSQRIMTLIREVTPLMQQRSVDEAYFDVSHARNWQQARKICLDLKQKIFQQEGLTASIGLGSNKLIAKIAANFQKPDGLTVVEENQAADFLSPLPVRDVPGVGPKTAALLAKKKIYFIKDIRQFSPEQLQDWLGVWGTELYRKAWGQDNSPLIEESITKSIGEQTTFYQDSLHSHDLIPPLLEIAGRLVTRLTDEGFASFRTIVLTVRFADFVTTSCRHTSKQPISSLEILRHHALALLLPFLDHRRNPHAQPIRLIGLRLEKLKQKAVNWLTWGELNPRVR